MEIIGNISEQCKYCLSWNLIYCSNYERNCAIGRGDETDDKNGNCIFYKGEDKMNITYTEKPSKVLEEKILNKEDEMNTVENILKMIDDIYKEYDIERDIKYISNGNYIVVSNDITELGAIYSFVIRQEYFDKLSFRFTMLAYLVIQDNGLAEVFKKSIDATANKRTYYLVSDEMQSGDESAIINYLISCKGTYDNATKKIEKHYKIKDLNDVRETDLGNAFKIQNVIELTLDEATTLKKYLDVIDL
ncbi:MAG: hypothetical protein K9L62_16740 [Vallitaleaceae bacterium]|nr:hypothetical protein [Vallitaleaceae bacterium]